MIARATTWMSRLIRRYLAPGFCLITGCAGHPSPASSDHSDGKHFFNARPTPNQSAFKIARHILFGRNGKWPSARIAADPALRDLSSHLAPDEVAVTFINHATVLVQLAGVSLLTDPVWSERVGPWSWAGAKRARDPGVAIPDLPRIDAVVVSHNHYDHLDLPTLRALASRDHPLFFVPWGDQSLLEEAGIARVVQLEWGQLVSIGSSSEIVFLPAQHNSGRTLFDSNRSLWGSYLIHQESLSVYFAGDTAYESHFEEARKIYGSVDLALLPIGAYRPRSMMQPFHMNPTEAVQAHIDLGARLSIGIHFGTFQLSGEDFDAPHQDLLRALEMEPRLPGPFIVAEHGKTLVFRFPHSTKVHPQGAHHEQL